MNIGKYAPSAQFTTIALSLLLSSGIVYAADYFTTFHNTTVATVDTSAQTDTGATDNSNWEASLYAIQAQNASTSLNAPDPQTLQQMLAAAQSSNVTDTVGKTILINLSNAKQQGLGNDIPTQNQIISAATAQIVASKPTLYTSANLHIVDDSKASLKAYGNGVMQILNNYPDASEHATLVAIDNATNKNDATALQSLAPIGTAYGAITSKLLTLPVPKTLSPFHLSIVNSYATMAAAYPDMQATITDPLRGIVGLQTYEAQFDTLARVFTNIAQALSKGGILFNKDEPGSAWSVLLSPQ